jgi:predicted nucleic acid-binding protein
MKINIHLKKLRVYLDNSVIGGCFDMEFEEHSNALFDYFRKNIYIPVISDNVSFELEGAPQKVKDNLLTLKNIEAIVTTAEMDELAKKYLYEKIVTKKYANDALHIAIATVSKVDVLVSWNFKHIVNLEKIHQFNAVNMRENYGILEIRTPKEVIKNG